MVSTSIYKVLPFYAIWNSLTPKILGLFLPISTSKNAEIFEKIMIMIKDYDLSDLLKKSCQKILKILSVVACLSSCNPLWVLWNFRG
jgi:hypothetical protein